MYTTGPLCNLCKFTRRWFEIRKLMNPIIDCDYTCRYPQYPELGKYEYQSIILYFIGHGKPPPFGAFYRIEK